MDVIVNRLGRLLADAVGSSRHGRVAMPVGLGNPRFPRPTERNRPGMAGPRNTSGKDLGENVALAEDFDFVAVDLDVTSGILAVNDLVAN